MSAQIDCPVCLNAVTDLVNCATTICGHKFHTSCLMKCVSHVGFRCPYCRSNMANEEDEEEEEEEEDEEDEEEEEEEEPVREPAPEPLREPEPVREPEPAPIVVRKMVFNGIAYLVAKRTGEVYDFNAYVYDGEQIEVGRWNAQTQHVELTV
jgi:hypothetical protein